MKKAGQPDADDHHRPQTTPARLQL